MGIPEQELIFFDLSGGMNTELGLVNTDEKTMKNLENVELKPDGSAERRSGLALLESALIDSEALNITSQRSQAGWVYPAPSMFIWRTIKDEKVTDFAVVGGIAEDGSSQLTINVKELVNGIADLENWSTDDGTQITHVAAVSQNIVANFKHRYIAFSDILMITHPLYRPTVLIGPTDTTTSVVVLSVRDPLSIAVDSIVKNNNIKYQCIDSHTSSSSTEPGVGSTWPTFWVRAGGASGSEAAWITSTAYTSNIEEAIFVATGSASLADPLSWTHAAFVGGRAWYAGMKGAPATVYVTQPLSHDVEDVNTVVELGYCFSVNDPHSATDSSPTAADGGTIQIKAAGSIESITEFREGLIIFATNGVWSIPNAGNFNATNFNVLKISDVPIAGPDAFAVTDTGIIYFGKNSVQILTITDNGNIVPQEISTPIKTFYNSISEFSKRTSFALYNKLDQRVMWFTTFVEPTYVTGDGPYRTVNFNTQPIAAQDILVFDLTLNAWYKYQIRKDQELADTDLMISAATTLVGDFGEAAREVTTLALDNVQSNSGADNVQASATQGTDIMEHYLMLLTGEKTISAAADVFRFGFAHLRGDVVQDFDNLPTADDALKSTFDSEILTHQLNFSDIGHNKTAPYIHTIFRRVETGILDAGGDDLTPGGCLLQFRWNWSTGMKAGPQFGTAFQAYNPFRWNINPGDGSLPDIEVVLNRYKIQGRGRALQLRYTNDGTNRFHLLGYQLEVEATKKV